MKGVVFTKFRELVEDKRGLTTVDKVLTKGCPSRPFADLAEGHIEASMDHFGESFIVRRTDMNGEPSMHYLFHLQYAKQT